MKSKTNNIHKNSKRLLTIGVLILSSVFFLSRPTQLESANLTSVTNTLTSTTYLPSRLSWGARIETDGTAEGASTVQIQSAPATPLNSTSTANLHAGDVILINANSYTVVGIIDADEFTVTPVIATGDDDDGDPIYLKIKPRHVIKFDTASAIADGFFQVLIPADPTSPDDGNLDDDGFDFTTGSIDVVAADVGNYDFITGTATKAAGTDCTAPVNYHCFEVHYSGSGGVGTTITINIGNLSGTNSLISPGEKSTHTEATADTYSFIVKNFPANADPDASTATDQTTGKIALIEAVRVTATVDPIISFSITGVGTGGSICGGNPDIDTSTGTNAPLAVPFGNITNLNTFYNAAHDLEVSTNADSGYVVTVSEDDELGKDGGTSPFIIDTIGDATASITNADDWETASNNGFGFSIENIDATTIPFEWDDNATDDCNSDIANDFCARQFANIAASETPQTIFSSTTVANAENIYICYRLSINATQEAGDYENQIVYTATGTF